jgi:hypothetical protein
MADSFQFSIWTSGARGEIYLQQLRTSNLGTRRNSYVIKMLFPQQNNESEQHRMTVYENRVLRRMFRRETEEVTG